MSEFAIMLFCAAVGFAVSGAVSSLYQLVTAKKAELLNPPKSGSAAAMVGAALVSLLGGPFIMARMMAVDLRSRKLSAVPALAGLIAVFMWSTLAGLFSVWFYVSLTLAS